VKALCGHHLAYSVAQASWNLGRRPLGQEEEKRRQIRPIGMSGVRREAHAQQEHHAPKVVTAPSKDLIFFFGWPLRLPPGNIGDFDLTPMTPEQSCPKNPSEL
jgi:hypothetical protein